MSGSHHKAPGFAGGYLLILNLQMAALGLLLGLIFVYDHPFEGGTAIKIDVYKELAARISK